MTTLEVVLLWSFVGLIASMFFALAVASVMGAVRDDDATYGAEEGARDLRPGE